MITRAVWVKGQWYDRKTGRPVKAEGRGFVFDLELEASMPELIRRKPGGNWPMECYASGVHPEQADQLRQEFIDVGVPTEVTKDGNPVYLNMNHRREALEARGLHDRAAYY